MAGKKLRVSGIKMPVAHELADVLQRVCKKLKIANGQIRSVEIAKKSIDARKNEVHYVYSVDIEIANGERYLRLPGVAAVQPAHIRYERRTDAGGARPLIVGAGPAGLFAALVLSQSGLNPLVLERGKPVEERMQDVDRLRQAGVLNPESNLQFGEGGAGTFSDGKLTTGIKDPRIGFVLDAFVQAGAPEEIKYLAKPHIGTDYLVRVVKNLREQIIENGGAFRFSNKLCGIEQEGGQLTAAIIEDAEKGRYTLETEAMILAVGHSARDTFEMLHKNGVPMEQKAFSVGVRIEHPREMIDRAQYGAFAENLPAADYKLATHLANGRGVYTFCMCPGGVVVPAASEEGRLAVNGMSNYRRDGQNSNSAVLVSVLPEDFPSTDALAGFEFQRRLETAAFHLGGGGYCAPVQLVGDFLAGRRSAALGEICPSYQPSTTLANLHEILPDYVGDGLKQGILAMDKKLEGFARKDAVLTAVESRSSSPVRLRRGADHQSALRGLIPCGEGAGYAGGIMSAAVDGIRCAESILAAYRD